MLFYMDVRYEGYDLYLDLELSENILPSNDSAPLHAVLSTLIEWHRNDPVDAWDQNRNDIIYYSYQKNRNPFIDHPEIVEHLWGNQVGVEWNSLLFSLADNTISNFIIYPSAVSEVLFIKNSTNSFVDAVVYNLLGKKVLFEKNTNTIDVRELPKGVYIIQITNELIKINKKFIKD